MMNSQVRISCSFDKFNKIVELSNMYCESAILDDVKKRGKKFINKVLTYSSIDDQNVVMYLYPVEAKFLINVLLNNTKEISETKNWIDILKENKENYNKERRS